MKKRILSLILAAAFVFLMMPLFTLPVAAAESVKVKTADELRAALKKDGDMVIELTADITKYKLPNDFKWDGYDEFFDTFFWVTVGKGTKKLYLQGHNVDIDDDFVTTAEYKEVKRYNTETGKEEAVKTLVKGLDSDWCCRCRSNCCCGGNHIQKEKDNNLSNKTKAKSQKNMSENSAVNSQMCKNAGAVCCLFLFGFDIIFCKQKQNEYVR